MAKIPIDIKSGEIKKNEAVVIGIDLGTTNSLVAYMLDGKPKTVRDKNGKHTLIPSVISFLENGNIIVGDDAKLRMVSHPRHTVYSVKRLLGRTYQDLSSYSESIAYQIIETDEDQLIKVKVDDKFYSPTELSAAILKYLKAAVEHELGHEVNQAVITVPAYFNDNQRQATKQAGKLAGLEVLRIVNEPTAASLAYGLGNEASGNVAVYDLGGGTFDISILEIQDGVFEVLSTNGDTFLGGDDFDKAIVNHWLSTNGIDLKTKDKSFIQAIRLQAEAAKIHLSANSEFSSNIGAVKFDLDRSTFDSLIQNLVNKSMASVKQALKDADKRVTDIDHLILVGGSTKVPLVRSTVEAYFQKSAATDLNPDEIVALGAAVQADVLAGNNKDVLLLDVTPLSMGIETVGGLMDVIIPRNSTVPIRAGRSYTTSVDGQKNLKVAVYQGERDLVEDNRKLAEFILKDIPPMPAGIPKIEIQFIINADGILKVKAMEKRSEKETSIQINNQYGISEEEMALMLMDSLKFAEADMKVRSLKESINEANNVILASEKFLVQNDSHLSEEEKSNIKSLLEKLRSSTAGTDKDIIENCMNELNEYSRPIAHRALDIAIGEAIKGKSLDSE